MLHDTDSTVRPSDLYFQSLPFVRCCDGLDKNLGDLDLLQGASKQITRVNSAVVKRKVIAIITHFLNTYMPHKIAACKTFLFKTFLVIESDHII